MEKETKKSRSKKSAGNGQAARIEARKDIHGKQMDAAGKAEFHRRRRLKYIAVLPTGVTLLNALCGFLAIVFACRGEGIFLPGVPLHKGGVSFFAMSGYLVLLAMVADIFDGQVARWSGTASGFGGQLDSLSDVISFGAAPAFLMFKYMEARLELERFTGGFLHPLWKAVSASPLVHLAGRWLLFSALFYLLCTVIRLARFNVENTTDASAHQYFAGLPSPAAAGVVVSLVIFQEDFLVFMSSQELSTRLSSLSGWLLPLSALGCGILMVSRVRYPHLANRLLRRKKDFVTVLLVLLAVLLAVLNIQLAMVLGFWGFAIAGIVCALWRICFRRRIGLVQ